MLNVKLFQIQFDRWKLDHKIAKLHKCKTAINSKLLLAYLLDIN